MEWEITLVINLHLGQTCMREGSLFLMGDCTLNSPFFYVMEAISMGVKCRFVAMLIGKLMNFFEVTHLSNLDLLLESIAKV